MITRMASESNKPKKPNKNSNQNKTTEAAGQPSGRGSQYNTSFWRSEEKRPGQKGQQGNNNKSSSSPSGGPSGGASGGPSGRPSGRPNGGPNGGPNGSPGGGSRGGPSNDGCENKWAYDIKYDISWWESYAPEEPTEEELFWVHAPGPKLRGYGNIPAVLSGPKPRDYSAIQSFEKAPLPPAILKNIEKSKYEKPTPVQKCALPVIFDGRDLMVCAQTGSGKTAAYLLPIVSNLLKMGDQLPGYSEFASPLALILLPTQDLARQVYIDAKRFAYKTNIRVVRAYGQCSHDDQIKELQNKCGCHILVATPGRLLTFMTEAYQRPLEISLAKVKYFVLDEADHMLVRHKKISKKDASSVETGADCMSESQFYRRVRLIVDYWEEKRELQFEYKTLKDSKKLRFPPKESRQTLMFSASLPAYFQFSGKEFLKNNYLHLLVGGEVASTCPDIEQIVLPVRGEEAKRAELLKILKVNRAKRTMVFVRHKQVDTKNPTGACVTDIVAFLTESGFEATGISSGRVQEEREESLREFRGKKQEEQIEMPIIVATAVGSRGLDIEGVELVINYDLPDPDYAGVEEYVHKVGRTGRIGNPGKAISFFDEQKDILLARSLRKELREFVPPWLDELCQSYKAFGTKEDQKRLLVSRDVRYISRKRNDYSVKLL